MPANGELNVIAVEILFDENNLLSSGNDSAFTSSEDEDINFQNSSKYSVVETKVNSSRDPVDLMKRSNKCNCGKKMGSIPTVNQTPRYTSLPVRSAHERLLRNAIDEMLELAVFEGTDRKNKVLEWHSPEELQTLFDFDLKATPDSDDKLLQLVRNVIKYSVKTGHPYFVNQLFSCVDPYALVGQWLTDALNPSVYTYEVAPLFVLMEEVVLQEMRRFVGFPNNGDGDGIFCPGGSIANGYAISLARYKYMPDVKTKGLCNLPRLVVFTSEDSHYSIVKLASFMGLGSDNVYKIKTDANGKLRLNHLESEILRAKTEGGVPFLVSATAGTTVMGAFDPLEGIADLCEKYNLWMHVDAAWGGGALMSKRYRALLKGIERADSVTWNPHKLLAVPQQCSTLLTKHKGLLAACHSTNATYLFQKDKFYDVKYDTGDKHIQCGRRADVLKFWFMWRAKGTEGMEAHVNKVFENAEFFTQQIKKEPSFEMVLENPEFTNICFWFIPPSLRNSPRDSDFNEKLHLIAPKIKERMMKTGTMMVTYQASHGLPNFFRFVLQSSALEHEDMLHIMHEIQRLGADL